MSWFVENFARSSLFDHNSLINKDHSVGDFTSEFHLMCDDNHGHPLATEIFHYIKYLPDEFRI